MTDRLISLTVGTKGAEEWFRTFQDFSELAGNLGSVHHYVNVTSSVVENDEESDDSSSESLYHDANTLVKVKRAIRNALLKNGCAANTTLDEVVDDIVTETLNEGILFRERL